MRYIVGLDLGQRQDPSALTVLELRGERPPYRYSVPHLERFRLGVSYVDIVQAVRSMLLISPLFGDSQLVIDQSGVGAPVADLFKEKGQAYTGIIITGGVGWHQQSWDTWLVSKHLLVSTVQKVLSSEMLSVGRELPQAELLKQELRDFRVKISKSANETYEAREGTHDDLVLSLAIALFVAEQFVPVMSW